MKINRLIDLDQMSPQHFALISEFLFFRSSFIKSQKVFLDEYMTLHNLQCQYIPESPSSTLSLEDINQIYEMNDIIRKTLIMYLVKDQFTEVFKSLLTIRDRFVIMEEFLIDKTQNHEGLEKDLFLTMSKLKRFYLNDLVDLVIEKRSQNG